MSKVNVKQIATRLALSHTTGRFLAAMRRDQFTVRGVKVRTDCPAVAPETKAALFFGRYERTEIDFAEKYLDPDLDTVEVGAGLGVTGALLRKMLRPPARLVCMEYREELLDLARRNLAAGPGVETHLLTVALAYDEQPEFVLPVGQFGSSSSYRHTDGDRVVRPAGRTLSSVLSEFGITRYQLVCDIEGSELDFLEHDPEALAQCHRMVIELHDTSRGNRDVRVADLRAMLVEGCGYRVLDEVGPVLALTR